MYAVENAMFQQARSIVASLAKELTSQQEAGIRRPADLHELVRRSTDVDLPEDGEADYLHAIADKLERTFPIEELFPRKRRTRDE
jgi:hypothetical protein